jgi:hypothetical protein
MQPTAIWIIYTLIFGYPVPTHDEHEFTNQAACEIHKHSYGEQIVSSFQLVCSRKSIPALIQTAGSGERGVPGE